MTVDEQIIDAARALAPKAIVISVTHHTHWRRAQSGSGHTFETYRVAVECGADGGFVRDASDAKALLAKLQREREGAA